MPTPCQNCGTSVEFHFCPQCGQENINYTDSLKHIVPEMLHEYLGWDSDILKSIPKLLFAPGFLTNEFNAGRRARYIPPLRMYLIASALFFIAQAYLPTGEPDAVPGIVSDGEHISYAPMTRHSLDSLERVVKAYQDSVAAARDSARAVRGLPPLGTTTTLGGSMFTDSTGQLNWFGAFMDRHSKHVKEHPEEFTRALMSNYPTALFLMMPLFALWLKIILIRRKRYYIEHLVHSFHVHSFVFLVLVVVHLLSYVLPGTTLYAWAIAIPWIAVYVFLSFRRVYRQSRFFSTVSYCLAVGGHAFILMAVMIATVALTFAAA